jgi:hypothetical protein
LHGIRSDKVNEDLVRHVEKLFEEEKRKAVEVARKTRGFDLPDGVQLFNSIYVPEEGKLYLLDFE